MPTIKHPDSSFSGAVYLGHTIADFAGGEAFVQRVPQQVLHRLTKAGYTVTEESGEPAVDLASLTVPELRERAEAEGFEVRSKARKADLIAALDAAAVDEGADQ